MASIGDDFQTRWWDLERKLMEKFGKKPDLESILFFNRLTGNGFYPRKN
jgi:hypothetical protein